MPELYEQLARLKSETEHLFQQLIVEAPRFAQSVGEMTLAEAADTAFVLKRIAETLDDARKELNRAKYVLEQDACRRKVQEQLTSTNAISGTIRGRLCTATTKVKSVVKVPDSGSPEYGAMLQSLGVPETSAYVLHVHWPHFVEYCSGLLERGEPLPKGIDPFLTRSSNELAFEVVEEKDFGLAFRGKDNK